MTTYPRAVERERREIKAVLLQAYRRRACIRTVIRLTARFELHPGEGEALPFITDDQGMTYRLATGGRGRLLVERDKGI